MSKLYRNRTLGFDLNVEGPDTAAAFDDEVGLQGIILEVAFRRYLISHFNPRFKVNLIAALEDRTGLKIAQKEGVPQFVTRIIALDKLETADVTDIVNGIAEATRKELPLKECFGDKPKMPKAPQAITKKAQEVMDSISRGVTTSERVAEKLSRALDVTFLTTYGEVNKPNVTLALLHLLEKQEAELNALSE